MKTHYIGMSGLRGCLPNYTTGACDSAYDAGESLVHVHELGDEHRDALRTERYVTLSLYRDGAEYAEIVECDCNNPDIHEDA